MSEEAPRRMLAGDGSALAQDLLASAKKDAAPESAKMAAKARLEAALTQSTPQSSDDGVQTSANTTRPATVSTGQRNENSVLFSLASLQATNNADKGASSAKREAEGSGLINLSAMTGGGGSGASKAKSVDDILSVGTGVSPLAAPVLAPVPAPTASVDAAVRKPVGTTTLLAVVSASVILVGGVLGAAFMLKSGNNGQGQQVAMNSGPTGTGAVGAGPATVGPTAATTGTQAIGTQPGTTGSVGTAGTTAPTGAQTPTGAETTAPTTTGTSTGGSRPERGSRDPRRSPSSSSSGSTTSASTGSTGSSSTTTASAPSSAGGSSCAARCRGDIGCLLSCGTSGGGSNPSTSRPASGAAAGGGSIPDAPSRADVQSAMRGVQGAVRACATGQTGLASVSITFANTGRVTTANVGPPFAGTVSGSCIARAVRNATIPAFSRPTFQVNYPFTL